MQKTDFWAMTTTFFAAVWGAAKDRLPAAHERRDDDAAREKDRLNRAALEPNEVFTPFEGGN